MFIPKLMGAGLSPGGRGAALSILIFHRVLATPDPLFPEQVDAARFDLILSWVRRCFTVLRLEQAIEMLKAGSLPPRALAVTFDDGYADNYTVALPILKKYEMSACFFIATGFLDGGRMFNDTVIETVRRFTGNEIDLGDLGLGRFAVRTIEEKRKTIDELLPKFKYLSLSMREKKVEDLRCSTRVGLPDDLMMTSAQVKALHLSGMTLGGHTRSHPILSHLDDVSAFEEISAGKCALEALLDEPISLFAYPNGVPSRDYTLRHVGMVRDAGFVAAVSTSSGVARLGNDVYQLPRFTPWDRTPIRFGLRMVNNMRSTGDVAT